MQNLIIIEASPQQPIKDNSFPGLDFFLPFSIGVLTTLLGFFLNWLWERWKLKRQEANSLKVIINELETNIEKIGHLKDFLQQDLSAIEGQQSIVNPLPKLSSDFASFLVNNCPSVFKNNPELLKTLRKKSKQTEEINEIIQSRESYRINNEGMDNYHGRLKIYNQILQKAASNTAEGLDNFIDALKTHIS